MPSSWCWQNCLAHNGSYTASLSWPWAVHVGAGLGSPTLSPQTPRAQSPAGFATLRSRLHACELILLEAPQGLVGSDDSERIAAAGLLTSKNCASCRQRRAGYVNSYPSSHRLAPLGKEWVFLMEGGPPEDQGRTGGGKQTGYPMCTKGVHGGEYKQASLHRHTVHQFIPLRLFLYASVMESGVSPKFTC